MSIDLPGFIREIPDFPKPGIGFKDITPLHGRRRARSTPRSVQLAELRAAARARGRHRRGGARLPARARRWRASSGAGFVLARKPGKLPHETVSAEYDLEYGTDSLELHSDAVAAGARVLVHDDLLATGGTAKALCDLVEMVGGNVVACEFLIELAFLDGRSRLAGYDVEALIVYDS